MNAGAGTKFRKLAEHEVCEHVLTRTSDVFRLQLVMTVTRSHSYPLKTIYCVSTEFSSVGSWCLRLNTASYFKANPVSKQGKAGYVLFPALSFFVRDSLQHGGNYSHL